MRLFISCHMNYHLECLDFLLSLLPVASLLNWSLISLADLVAFVFIQYTAPKIRKLLRPFFISYFFLFLK